MLKLIIEKELRENIKTTKFAITFCICSILILLSFYTGARNYQVAKARYEAAKAENLRKLEGMTDWMQVRQFRIYLPPQPIEALVSGVSNDIGRTIEIKNFGELKAQDSLYGNDPIYAIFRFMDLDFIFTVILSLFAILFAYDSINGEKERGTLRLTLSYAVPRDIYISGKIIGSFLALIIPLMIPLLIGALLLPVFGAQMDGAAWGKLSMVIIAGILLTGSFLTLSVMVSSITQKSSSSFLILLVVWIMAVMIIPRLSVITSGAFVKVPTVAEMNSQKGKLQTQLWNEEKKSFSNFKAPAGATMEETMSALNKYIKNNSEARENKIMQLANRLNEERTNKEMQLEHLAFSFARLSPVAVFSFAAQEAVGTSLKLQEDLQKAALDYRTVYNKFMNDKTGGKANDAVRMYTSKQGDGETPKTINTREIPEFVFASSSAAQNLAGVFPEMGLLVLFNIIFFAVTFIKFKKYDVR